MKPDFEWRQFALVATAHMRQRLKEVCGQFHHWPIVVRGTKTYLPLDPVIKYRASNDNEFRG